MMSPVAVTDNASGSKQCSATLIQVQLRYTHPPSPFLPASLDPFTFASFHNEIIVNQGSTSASATVLLKEEII